jgi:hypothetical protein
MFIYIYLIAYIYIYAIKSQIGKAKSLLTLFSITESRSVDAGDTGLLISSSCPGEVND